MVSLAFKTQEQIIDQSFLVSWVSGIHGNLLHSLNTTKIKTSNLQPLFTFPYYLRWRRAHHLSFQTPSSAAGKISTIAGLMSQTVLRRLIIIIVKKTRIHVFLVPSPLFISPAKGYKTCVAVLSTIQWDPTPSLRPCVNQAF